MASRSMSRAAHITGLTAALLGGILAGRAGMYLPFEAGAGVILLGVGLVRRRPAVGFMALFVGAGRYGC
jgi:hypothetical protein